jgi:hypothetical protein
LLLADHDGPLDRRDRFGLAAGAAALLCSGVAITMIVVVGIAVFIRRGIRIAAVHTVPFAVAYLVWFSTMGRDAYTASGTNVGDKVKFIVTTPFNALRAMGSYRGAQVVLALLLVVGLVLAWRKCSWAEWSKRYAAPFALLIGAGIYLVITAVGRAGPSGAAFRGRYLDIVLALALPAIGVAADAIIRARRVLAVPVFAALLVGIPSNMHAIWTDTAGQRKSNAQYRQTVLALPRVPASRTAAPKLHPIAGISIGWLRAGVSSGRIPPPAPISPVELATDQLRFSLIARGVAGGVAGATAGRCRTLTGPVTLHLGRHQSIRIAQGEVQFAPATGPIDGTYPMTVRSPAALSPHAGPLTFRALPTNIRGAARLCGPY